MGIQIEFRDRLRLRDPLELSDHGSYETDWLEGQINYLIGRAIPTVSLDQPYLIQKYVNIGGVRQILGGEGKVQTLAMFRVCDGPASLDNIGVEFNPDLALRNISHYYEGKRSLEECIPERLCEGDMLSFLKEGQRNYWFHGEVPLLETKGNQQLSRPLAAITIVEAMHFWKDGKVYTQGTYCVKKVLDPTNPEVYFEGMNINPHCK